MGRLRQELDPEANADRGQSATRFRTEANRHGIHCIECGELYYVDESTLSRIEAAMKWDPSDGAFCCDDCEAEYVEESRSHP